MQTNLFVREDEKKPRRYFTENFKLERKIQNDFYILVNQILPNDNVKLLLDQAFQKSKNLPMYDIKCFLL